MLSCWNKQILSAVAPMGASPKISHQLVSRVSSTVLGLTPSRRPAPPRRFAATQAMAQEVPLQEATIGIAEWNKDLVNCVSLIGRLAAPLEIRSTPTSRQVANGRLAVNNGKDLNGVKKPPTWINIETWGELAQSARELKKGEQIQVMGRMKREEYTGKDGQVRIDTKVTVNQINRISDSMGPSYGQDAWDQSQSQVQSPQYAAYDVDQTAAAPWGDNSAAVPAARPGEEQWAHLMNNLDQYWDNRVSKRNPNAPDFKLKGKENDVPLWLNKAPQWVLDRLKDIPAPA